MTYDSRGNIRKLGAQTLIYDRSDQPIILNGTISGNYRYDGNMKRVKSLLAGKTIYNVYDASGTLVHIDAVTDNKKTDYIDKIARISSGPGFNLTTYLHNDHLGSAVSGTTSTGSINWTERYTPYGEKITDPTANRDQASFTGHIDDSATGLTYMQARYYDPVLGRFLSSDPVGFTPDMPFMFGRYTYVGGDPINLIDPFGLAPGCGSRIENNVSSSCFSSTGSFSFADGSTGGGGSSADYHESANDTPKRSSPTNNASNDQELASGEVIDMAGADMALITTAAGGVKVVYSAGKGLLRSATGATVTQSTPALINQAHHVFGKGSHNMAGVLSKFGNDPIKATNALNRAAQRHINTHGITGRFQEVIKFGGSNVTIRGNVVDGIARVPTAFIPLIP